MAEPTWVVVVFGSANPDYCDLNHCPMHAVGPFETNKAAHEEADRFPEWMRPHVLSVEQPIEAADG